MGERLAGAMKVRLPVFRQRPWVTDGVWIAHESLPLFDKIAAQLPLNGAWDFTADGPERRSTGIPDLTPITVDGPAAAQPCVTSFDQQFFDDLDEAMDSQLDPGTICVAEVIDADGKVWHFDADILTAVTAYRDRAPEWRLYLHPDGKAFLYLFDHKGRMRFGTVNAVQVAS